jgi:hypothetical protein
VKCCKQLVDDERERYKIHKTGSHTTPAMCTDSRTVKRETQTPQAPPALEALKRQEKWPLIRAFRVVQELLRLRAVSAKSSSSGRDVSFGYTTYCLHINHTRTSIHHFGYIDHILRTTTTTRQATPYRRQGTPQRCSAGLACLHKTRTSGKTASGNRA